MAAADGSLRSYGWKWSLWRAGGSPGQHPGHGIGGVTPGFWAALTAVAALAAAGCAGTGRPPSAPPPSSSLPKTTLTACTVEGLYAECGYVWVPQDWTHPDGPAMPLQVVVLPVA
jgi:hypothetical protein